MALPLLVWSFLSVIVSSRHRNPAMTCRCNPHSKRGSVSLPSKVGLITLFLDSFLGSGTCNNVFLISIFPGRVNDDVTLPTGDTSIFGADFPDYGPKSIFGTKWNPLRLCKVGRRGPGVSIEIIGP